MLKNINLFCLTLLLCTLTARHAEGAIVVSGDFVSGPTGGPITSTDPAFWTGGGDPATDPNTDGIVGVTSDGLLAISGGSVLNLIHLDAGANSGATGTVNVMGAGSALNLGEHLHLGSADVGTGGNGVLNVTGGGVVNVTNDIFLADAATNTGTVVVDGAGSVLETGDDLFVGNTGTGSLTITNGGLVEVADLTKLGDDTGSSGSLLIDGAGSMLKTRDIDIGEDGPGQATVSNGARLEASDDINITDDVDGAGSSLTVQGANTTIFAVDNLSVGKRALGTLNMSDGARAEAHVVRLGDFAGGFGVINVQGANSTIVSDDNYLVGHNGSGHLTVSDGARAEAGHFFFVGLNPGAVGRVTVRGPGTTLETITGGFTLSEGGTGRLHVLDGAQVTVFAETTIGNGATGEGSVTVSGNNSLLSSTSIVVGGFGKGGLHVLNGGQAIASDHLSVGESAGGGTVHVRGAGSNVSAASMEVGAGGPGRFNLSETGSAGFETVEVSATGTVNMVVSGDNMLTATASFTNDGTTNFIAGSRLASGSYTPIDSSVFSGSGSYVGVGGTTGLSSGKPFFTVAAIQTDSGNDGTESVGGAQRVLFNTLTVGINEDSSSGDLGVTQLVPQTIANQRFLDGYSLTATNGLSDNILTGLTFDLGLGGQASSDQLSVFQRLTGAGQDTWALYEPAIFDLTDDSFTFTITQIDGFDYAVTAIPEPAVVALVGVGGLALGCRCRFLQDA